MSNLNTNLITTLLAGVKVFDHDEANPVMLTKLPEEWQQQIMKNLQVVNDPQVGPWPREFGQRIELEGLVKVLAKTTTIAIKGATRHLRAKMNSPADGKSSIKVDDFLLAGGRSVRGSAADAANLLAQAEWVGQALVWRPLPPVRNGQVDKRGMPVARWATGMHGLAQELRDAVQLLSGLMRRIEIVPTPGREFTMPEFEDSGINACQALEEFVRACQCFIDAGVKAPAAAGRKQRRRR